MMKDDFAIGLDLGTTNCCIGVFRNGSVEIIPNRMGERTTPSIVTFLDGGMKVGEDTIDSLVKDYDKSIYQIKRFIGRKYADSEVEEDIGKVPFSIVESKKGFPNIQVEKSNQKIQYSPEEISSFIIKKMMEIAEEYLKRPIKNAVITVPAYFNDAQRTLTKRAAELVGVTVDRVLNEPTAAALAYGLEKGCEKKNTNILVFDLGGGTFDVSILKLNQKLGDPKSQTPGREEKEDGLFDVLATDGDTHLGGEDFDNVLVDYFIKQFCNENKIKEEEIKKDKKNMKKLKINCESIKRDLSKADETVLCIDGFYKDKDQKDKDILEAITREEFEKLSQGLFDRIQIPINKALQKAKLNEKDINEVLLIGGSTRIPKIKEILKGKFQNSKINDSINPDEAVAYGATLYAAKIKFHNDDKLKGINLIDICPMSLGTGIINESSKKEERDQGDKMDIIIEKGTRIPCDRTKIFQTGFDNQTEAAVEIYEGENNYVKYNHYFGRIILADLPKKRAGLVTVKVQYKIDVNGIFTASTLVTNTGDTICKVINDKVNLSEEEVKEIQEKNKDVYLKKSKILPILESYQEMKKNLDMCENSLNQAEDEDEKIGVLLNYNKYLEEFIDKFGQDNFDNEIILEKSFDYIHQLFINYAKTLKMKDLEKEDADNIITNIKKYLEMFKKHSFGYITKLLEEIKEIKREKFYDIVIYVMGLMNDCGKKWMEKHEEFCRYHSIVYFEHCLYLAKVYINEAKFGAFKNRNIFENYEKISKEGKEYLDSINSNAFLILRQNKMTGKLIQGQGHTGYTYSIIGLKPKMGDREKNELVLANYEKMYREISLQKDRKQTEEEAICIANIIKISFKFLANSQYQRYLNLADQVEFIVRQLKDFDTKKDWYREFQDLTKKIRDNNKVKIEFGGKAVKECRERYPDIFSKIDKCAENRNRKVFIDFILAEYPYDGYEEDKKKNKINFNVINKELIDYLCWKYKPDNYDLTIDEDVKLRYAEIHEISSKLSSIYSEFQ